MINWQLPIQLAIRLPHLPAWIKQMFYSNKPRDSPAKRAKRAPLLHGAPYPEGEDGDILILWDFSQTCRTPDARRVGGWALSELRTEILQTEFRPGLNLQL